MDKVYEMGNNSLFFFTFENMDDDFMIIPIPIKSRPLFKAYNIFLLIIYRILNKMTYSDDLKKRIINCIRSKKYTNAEIIKIFGTTKRTFYKIKNESFMGSKYTPSKKLRRTRKINGKIRSYIRSYVLTNINFNYKKLITLINKNYGCSISKTTIYQILHDSKIKKKRL